MDMKKVVLLASVLMLPLSMLVFIQFVVPVKADPKTIYVDASNTGFEDGTQEHPYNTIKEGINAASPGDTVFVYNGIYNEREVTLNKDNLSLVGENRDNTIIDGKGLGWTLKIVEASNVTISGFTIQNSPSGKAGIFLYYSTKNNISNNILKDHDVAIYSVFSNSNVIESNKVTDNLVGIDISMASSKNKIENNDVISNELYGIALIHGAHSNEVENNNIFQNKYGIRMSYRSENNSIFNNQIINNQVGIYEDELTHGYRIFHNNFINNTLEVDLHNSSVNAWDNGVEGNYWSNYNGTDFDQDGIGDAPYILNQNNQDNHPLMGMFSDFPVTWEEKTYHVTTICNSTISAFQFDQVNEVIRFNVTGENETLGFCRIRIPKALMDYASYTVLVDGSTPLMEKELPRSNSTHEYLYFTYTHSTREITITPELPPPPPFWVQWWFWIIIGVVGVGIVLIVAVYLLRRRKPPTPTAPPLPPRDTDASTPFTKKW
ncbi:MAG: nitrous oxide reductase family maturation protein NosD [Candidatus Bathyarchaeia archaeon]